MTGPHLLHVAGPLERWDHIAWRYYGNAAAYGAIIAANRDLFPAALVPVPQFVPAGTELKIPVMDAPMRARPDQLPPWMR